MNKISVHIYPSSFAFESRILKIALYLRDAMIADKIIVLAVQKPGLAAREEITKDISVVRLNPLPLFLPFQNSKVGKAIGWYGACIKYLFNRNITYLSCHSLFVLPLCVTLKFLKSCYLIYEPHELETETLAMKGWKKYPAKLLEKVLIGRCNSVCLVNKSISKIYNEKYALPGSFVVRNVPQYIETVSRKNGVLRNSLGIDTSQLVFLYQGLLTEGRGIKIVSKAFLGSEHALVFMGYGPLREYIIELSRLHKNIYFHEAVSLEELPNYTADADVGLCIIEDICKSYYLSLPNKLFEYAHSGVPQLTSNFPEMREIVSNHNSGWSIEPSESQVKLFLKNINLADISRKLAGCQKLKAQITWDNETEQLRSMYDSLK